MFKKLFIIILLLSTNVIFADDKSGTLVPDFQVAPFSQLSYVYGVSSRTVDPSTGDYIYFEDEDTPGVFYSVEMDQIHPDAIMQLELAILTLYNNNPMGFEIIADGANNAGSEFVAFHSVADNLAFSDNFDGNGHHTIVYQLIGEDKASSAANSGFGSSYGSGTSTASSGGQVVFLNNDPTKATQNGQMLLWGSTTGSEILDSFNTEEDNERYSDTITVTLREL